MFETTQILYLCYINMQFGLKFPDCIINKIYDYNNGDI